MNFKKTFAGVLTGAMVAAMSVSAFAEPVYYTDESLEVDESFTDVTMATLVAETTAASDITGITYDLTCADNVSFNEYAYLHIVVTVDGTSTDYSVQGIGSSTPLSAYAENEWTTGYAIKGITLTFDSTIKSGSTYKIEAYTQSWKRDDVVSGGDFENPVYDVVVTDIATVTGDVAPVAYLGAIIAVAGIAMVASKKVRA